MTASKRLSYERGQRKFGGGEGWRDVGGASLKVGHYHLKVVASLYRKWPEGVARLAMDKEGRHNAVIVGVSSAAIDTELRSCVKVKVEVAVLGWPS